MSEVTRQTSDVRKVIGGRHEPRGQRSDVRHQNQPPKRSGGVKQVDKTAHAQNGGFGSSRAVKAARTPSEVPLVKVDRAGLRIAFRLAKRNYGFRPGAALRLDWREPSALIKEAQ
jgi:hypothetical protein